MLSAFSLFYTMPSRLRERRPLLSFYLHRFFRIAPLFYAWLTFRLLRDALWLGITHPPLHVIANVLFVFNPFKATVESLVFAGWTLGVEMPFYAMFPAIYRIATNLWRAVALFVGCILIALAYDYASGARAVHGLSSDVTNWFFVKHLPQFACGAIMFYVLMACWRREAGRESRLPGLALTAIAVLFYVAYLRDVLPPLFGRPQYWLGLIWATLAIGLALAPLRLIVNPVTAYLGTLGYSIYLNHPLLVYVLIRVYRPIGTWFDSPTASFLVCIALTLAILIPISALTYRFVEQPGVRLGQRLVGRFS
jgi:peptidoglycan/LPS O-acetylase OafA/YrhL